ncbi:hypothetical protein COO91_09952 (plasmid) [Nostoc flagelliforme CCNUN1]|uniref:Uncharacterized protein n=1 Tax=Nostoc flagelliforme CCNUN1 TaxID=2038116 RepID=A0A2K8T7W3_9NOSO|nr:hypothetical protein COO91_09952 [Nostoc flagelliforme CCNUN1]
MVKENSTNQGKLESIRIVQLCVANCKHKRFKPQTRRF